MIIVSSWKHYTQVFAVQPQRRVESEEQQQSLMALHQSPVALQDAVIVKLQRRHSASTVMKSLLLIFNIIENY